MILRASNIPILVALSILIFQSFLQKIFEGSLLYAVDDVVFVAILPWAVIGLRRVLASVHGQIACVCFLGFVTLDVAGTESLFSRGPLSQLYVEIKLFATLLVCFSVRDAQALRLGISRILNCAALASVPLCLMQYVSPGLYDQVFSAGAHHNWLVIDRQALLPRAAGVFVHPTHLAALSAIGALITTFDAWAQRRTIAVYFWPALHVLLLILSLQRQEVASFVLSLAAMIALLRNSSRVDLQGLRLSVLVLAVFSAVVLGVVIYGPTLYLLIADSGLAEFSYSTYPRTVLARVGSQIATDNFPLGAGLGSFGGVAAIQYDSPVYSLYGFDRFYWYREGLYLFDSFWPHVIAEAGWIGAALILSGIVMLGLGGYSVISSRRNERALSAALYLFVFTVSISTPSYYFGMYLLPSVALCCVGSRVPRSTSDLDVGGASLTSGRRFVSIPG